jgi:hypothetical protein
MICLLRRSRSWVRRGRTTARRCPPLRHPPPSKHLLVLSASEQTEMRPTRAAAPDWESDDLPSAEPGSRVAARHHSAAATVRSPPRPC